MFESRDRFSKMKRALKRIEQIYANTGSSISTSDARDAVESFVSDAHHFKDYLKREYTAQAKQIEAFVTDDRALSIVADLSNSFKHATDVANRRKEHARQIGGSDIGELVRINTHTAVELGPGFGRCSQRLEIVFREARFDALELARDAVASWIRFLDQEKIELET